MTLSVCVWSECLLGNGVSPDILHVQSGDHKRATSAPQIPDALQVQTSDEPDAHICTLSKRDACLADHSRATGGRRHCATARLVSLNIQYFPTSDIQTDQWPPLWRHVTVQAAHNSSAVSH